GLVSLKSARIKSVWISLLGCGAPGIGGKARRPLLNGCHKVVSAWLEIQHLVFAEIIGAGKSHGIHLPGASLTVDVTQRLHLDTRHGIAILIQYVSTHHGEWEQLYHQVFNLLLIGYRNRFPPRAAWTILSRN